MATRIKPKKKKTISKSWAKRLTQNPRLREKQELRQHVLAVAEKLQEEHDHFSIRNVFDNVQGIYTAGIRVNSKAYIDIIKMLQSYENDMRNILKTRDPKTLVEMYSAYRIDGVGKIVWKLSKLMTEMERNYRVSLVRVKGDETITRANLLQVQLSTLDRFAVQVQQDVREKKVKSS